MHFLQIRDSTNINEWLFVLSFCAPKDFIGGRAPKSRADDLRDCPEGATLPCRTATCQTARRELNNSTHSTARHAILSQKQSTRRVPKYPTI